jgi:hypothetical protein
MEGRREAWAHGSVLQNLPQRLDFGQIIFPLTPSYFCARCPTAVTAREDGERWIDAAFGN